jgi:drug/metabolite transporter (DMT)-like permease
MIGRIADILSLITGGWFLFELGRRFLARIKHKEDQISTAGPRKVPDKRDYTLGIIYSVCCALLWSLSYVSLSYVRADVDLLEMNVVLVGFGAVFLFIGSLLARQSKNSEINSLDISVSWNSTAPWILAAANIASFLLFIYALSFISASQTITLQKINPIFVAIATWIWLRRKPSRSTLSTVFLVVSGTILITVNEQFGFTGGDAIRGSVFAILAGASFALFGVAIEKIEQGNSGLAGRLRFLSGIFIVSYVCIISLAYFQGSLVSFDRTVLIVLGLNGLRVAVVYALYYAAIRRIGALFASVLVAIEVPLTMLWDWTLLNRPPGLRLIWGSIAILLGAATLTWEKAPYSNNPPSKAEKNDASATVG